MSRPMVYARAARPSAAAREADPACTRTLSRLTPSCSSIGARTASASGKLGSRLACRSRSLTARFPAVRCSPLTTAFPFAGPGTRRRIGCCWRVASLVFDALVFGMQLLHGKAGFELFERYLFAHLLVFAPGGAEQVAHTDADACFSRQKRGRERN